MSETLQAAFIVLLAISALLAVLSMLVPRWPSDQAPMILGVSLVSILALSAADAWVYGVAVVMVAAPIAGPAFAQNIAAIFLDREWAIADRGTEVKPSAAAARDRSPLADETQDALPARAHSPWEFESSGISALANSSAYDDAEIRSDIVLRGPAGRAAQIDAVALRPDGSAELFEFKTSIDPGRLRREIDDLDKWRRAYGSLSNAPSVSATMVVPSDYPRIRYFSPDVRIARFDQASGEITWDDQSS